MSTTSNTQFAKQTISKSSSSFRSHSSTEFRGKHIKQITMIICRFPIHTFGISLSNSPAFHLSSPLDTKQSIHPSPSCTFPIPEPSPLLPNAPALNTKRLRRRGEQALLRRTLFAASS